MTEEKNQNNMVKSSNLGYLIGVLVVVTIIMLIYKSSFVQSRLGKESDLAKTTQTTGGFEIIDEPEITLIGDDEILSGDELVADATKEVSDVAEEEVLKIDTHEPVDTAIGDVNPLLIISLFFAGAFVTNQASKRFVK